MILQGDCLTRLREIPDESVHCVVTSPPYYGLRDYGFHGQVGLEKTPDEYVSKLVEVFREVRRVLRTDGVLFLNLGDSYASGKGTCYNPGGGESSLGMVRKDAGAHPLDRGNVSDLRDQGLKPKDLIGIPWRVAFALQADGWYLRSDIIWAKPNPVPESVTDRCTKSHEYIFMFTKSARYFYDNEAVKEPATSAAHSRKGLIHPELASGPTARNGTGQYDSIASNNRIWGNSGTRNRRDVWTIATKPYRGAHFAVFPPDIPEICIKAGTSERGCCPVCGAPWVRVVERTADVDETAKGSFFDRGKTGARDGGDRTQPGERYLKQTIGFSPSCSCGAGKPVPCTVLDPFAGSGTTGAVAKSLGRDYILIEANPDYIELIEARLAAAERPPATLEDFAP